jgi:hypothetical protein
MHDRRVMKTIAAVSLFSLLPAAAFMLVPASARAQQVAFANPYESGILPQPGILPQSAVPPSPANPADPDGRQPPEQAQPIEPPRPVDPSHIPHIPQLPEPYQSPTDPYGSANDAPQVDWPQDVVPEESAADSYDDGYDPNAYAQFQDELSPYGDWVDDGTYGRIWVPETSLVGADFTPYYSGGHWVLTEFGWTWVSDWSWGWAPFHYGRWIQCSHGWGWVPGRIWGPAWVSWRSGGGWVGWAALPPRGVSVTATYGARTPWRFSRLADLGAPRPRCVPMRDMPGMFHRTTLVTNDRVLTRGQTTVHINAGPRFVPNATPHKLMAVAPQAFPQRAVLPQRGVNMADRPWIRAASSGPVPATAGAGIRGGAGFGAGHGPGMRTPARAPAAATPQPRIYNPPRTFASTVTPRAFGSPAPAGVQPARGYGSPAYSAPRAFGGAPVNNGPRVYNYNQPTRSYGAPPSSNVRVYSPPPRPFAQPPAQRPPAQSFHPSYTPAPAHVSQPRSFSAPAPSFGGGGGFGHAGGGGGGMHFGGGGRRR